MAMPSDPGRGFAVEVVRRLQAAGHLAYWAGGCVRDLILGRAAADFDVATDATPDRVMGLFRRTVPVGISFGVVRVLGPPGAGEVEVATFRSDGDYRDGRRPESVRFGSPGADAARRDFTINGMFFDPLDGNLVDLVGGRADLDAKVLRAIGDPAARFAEDKLRLLRAVRFAARFDLAIEPGTDRALRAMAAEVVAVAAERIAQELRKMLVDPNRARAMALGRDVGLLGVILPSTAMVTPDDWSRTLAVLDGFGLAVGFPLAFAALLLDAGAAGVELAGRSLKLANAEIEGALWLAGHAGQLNDPRTLPRSRLKRLLAAPGIGDLLALHRAVALASGSGLDAVAYCEAYLRDEPDGPIDPPPILTGDDLVRHGLKPGREFARLLEAIRTAQLEGEVTTRVEALARVDAMVRPRSP